MPQRPHRIRGSSFGCTAYGGYCFDCKVPIGDESFKYLMLKSHCYRLKIHDNIGTSTSLELAKIAQEKIRNLQGVKINYVTDERKLHYCCSVCSKYYTRLDSAKKHQTDGKCKKGTISEKYLAKTTCGRFVEPPQNNFEQNIPEDQAEVEPPQEELMQQPPSMISTSRAISQPPYRFEGSSFGCTAYGGYCFVCEMPIGDESFNYGTFKGHWNRNPNIHHTMGTSSARSKKEFGKVIQNKIQTLQNDKINYVTNERKLRYCCSICNKDYNTVIGVKKHLTTEGKCKKGTFSEKNFVKTTCGRFVESPQNNLEENIPQDQPGIESSQEQLIQKMFTEISKLKESHDSKVEELTRSITDLKELIGQQNASFNSCNIALNANLAEKDVQCKMLHEKLSRKDKLNEDQKVEIKALNANLAEKKVKCNMFQRKLSQRDKLIEEQKLEIEALKSKNIELMGKPVQYPDTCQSSTIIANSTLNNKKRKQDEL